MRRDIEQNLLQWKGSDRRKPLVLRGARQTGKTYSLREFGQQCYKRLAYLNFEETVSASQLFQADLDPQRIISEISLMLDMPIVPAETLIVFDEIQACPNALTSLKYFAEKAGEHHVAAAGSLLGVKLGKPASFPVGKVNFLDLYPLSFCEFLDALDKNRLREHIDSVDRLSPLPVPIHEQLTHLLKVYTYTGGMPEVVMHYRENQDLRTVRTIQKEVLDAYLLDLSKHADPREVMKISTVWNQVQSQLAKENKKFIFSAVRKSARGRDYENAIQWLLDAGLIYKSVKISAPRLPVEAYAQSNIFKIYLLDPGLLAAMADIPARILVEGDRLFTEYKGAFIENLAAATLVGAHGKQLYYWASDNLAEVDFVVPYEHVLYPLEVKAGISRKKKSLLAYDDRYHPSRLVRTTLMNLRQDGRIINIPLYLLHRFPEIILAEGALEPA